MSFDYLQHPNATTTTTLRFLQLIQHHFLSLPFFDAPSTEILTKTDNQAFYSNYACMGNLVLFKPKRCCRVQWGSRLPFNHVRFHEREGAFAGFCGVLLLGGIEGSLGGPCPIQLHFLFSSFRTAGEHFSP